MAKVLGLSFFFHDSSAALVCDGRVVAAVTEERFCRRKHTNEFPKHSIEYCLEAGELKSINELDAIVFYEKPIMKLHRIIEVLVAVWPRGLQTFVEKLPAFLSTKFNVYRTIEKMLPGYGGEILFADHHQSHAASAYYCSPFKDAAILTIDGVGEWETTTMGMGKDRNIELNRAIHFPHSIGLLYSALTGYLGFRVNDGEWKVMGLAPYGDPKYAEQFRQLVEINADGSFRLDMDMFVYHYSSKWTAHHDRWQKLFGFPPRGVGEELQQHHEDLARSGQVVIEEMILSLAREAQRRSGSENLVIAGGVGLNSVANWKIEQQGIFKNIWIQPAPGDDGGALGAALIASQMLFSDTRTPEMTDAYLGPSVEESDIDSFMARKGIDHERLDEENLVERVADIMSSGQVVGWFRGRMEFGPRSLGSRSILADATNPDMKAIINEKIKYREYFRPFAPAVPLDEVHEYFDVPPGTALPFMLKVPQVRSDKRSLIPAVTHEDGTGRVQTVTEDSNPSFYKLLKALKSRTGVPIALNTSFNVRGEPIVCSLDDAWTCFNNTGIDALVLGNCLITSKPKVDIDWKERYAHSDALEEKIGTEEGRPSGSLQSNILNSLSEKENSSDTTNKVLNFYKELPFNYYSNAVDTTIELSRENRIKSYPVLNQYLKETPSARVIDVGCGAGWFVNSCAHYYKRPVVGVDLNPVVLKQARAVARLMHGCEKNRFVQASVFEHEPDGLFDVVNSLGVLHHTPDCHGAIRRVVRWISPGQYLHLGLYHHYGRKPFLDHFANMQAKGRSEIELYEEFKRLNPDITDETHMLSWFRDQVLHPHETQHTYEEIEGLLRSEGLTIERTSINRFKSLESMSQLVKREKKMEEASKVALYDEGRYYPGFFVVWAKKEKA